MREQLNERFAVARIQRQSRAPQRTSVPFFLRIAALVTTLIMIGCVDGADETLDTRSRGQASSTVQNVQVSLPEGVALSEIGLLATTRLTLADRAKVLNAASSTGYGAVVNTGTSLLEAGADTKTEGLFSGAQSSCVIARAFTATFGRRRPSRSKIRS